MADSLAARADAGDVDAAVIAALRAAGCVFAEDEAALLIEAAQSRAVPESGAASGADRAALLAELVGRRVAGEPLEYILGWAQFCGLRIAVDPGVFVPRLRTELMVREAAAAIAPPTSGTSADATSAGPGDSGSELERVVVDLCCGSGAIGVAIAAAAERAGRRVQLNAADLDPAAVACARRNVEPIGGRVFEGDLLAALPDSLRGTVDVLAVNAPYVPTASIALMPPEAREHEHRIALDGGSDGLSVHRRVCAAATDWLAPGGRLLIEASEDQAPRTAELMAAAGLRASIVQDDDVDGTVVIGIRP